MAAFQFDAYFDTIYFMQKFEFFLVAYVAANLLVLVYTYYLFLYI